MMSIENVARAIAERYGISARQSKRIARAAAHRRCAAAGCGDVPQSDAPAPHRDPDGGRSIGGTLGALAQEISVVATIPMAEAILIANRVVVRLALSLERSVK
jgi:hypothetical protein